MTKTLADALDEVESPVELLRDLGVGRFTKVRDQFTHWIEENRSWAESVALADLSYHMADLEVDGPGALQLLSDVSVNSFDGFEPGKAKQLVVVNPEGYMIGDGILFYLDEEEFLLVGTEAPQNWIRYQLETGDYDATARPQGRPVATRQDPNYYRYQLQGPNAIDVMADIADEPLPDLGFFNFTTISLAGTDAHILRHGMANQPGYEFWGPYEHSDTVTDAILETGEEYGLQRLGAEIYQTTGVVTGWIPLPVPAIYDSPEMESYREWLEVRRGMLSIGGSFNSGDISDYYMTPGELGYDRHVDLEKDFIGRDAVADQLENPERTQVTFVWEPEDVLDIWASLFDDGETYKYISLPQHRSGATQYDEVRKDGEYVGISKWIAYTYNERSLISLGCVDVDLADPGTEVTIVHGEPDGGEANPHVERHVQTEIRATVAPVPFVEDHR